MEKSVRRVLRGGFHPAALEPDAAHRSARRIHYGVERGFGTRGQLHHRWQRRSADGSSRSRFGIHAEQRDAFVRAAHRTGVGSARQRQDRGSRGLRNLLLIDRCAGVPAEFAASLQWLGDVHGSAFVLPADCTGRAASCRNGVRTPGRAARREDSGRRRMESDAGTAADVEHGAARFLHRIARLSRLDQRGSEQHPRPNLCERGRLHRRRHQHNDERGGARRAIYSRWQASESESFGRLLLVHGGQQQLQRLAGGRDAPHDQWPAGAREFHVVEKFGHELGIDRRTGE